MDDPLHINANNFASLRTFQTMLQQLNKWLSYVIGLEVFDIFVQPFCQLRETRGSLKIGRLNEGSPRPDLLPSFVEPFPKIQNVYF